MRGRVRLICLLSVAVFFALSVDVRGDELRDVPVKGMVTMLDLGAKSCIPCKMMAPILEKLEKVFRGKAAIIFIDVWEHNDQVRRFGLHAIPTQIFYDKDGKEVYRHVGFMSEEAIIGQLKKMGVDQSARQPQPVD
jgi:thioredoxin 1